MAVTINGTTGIITPDIEVDSTTLTIDSSNNRVGIGTSTPSDRLTVDGIVKIDTANLDALRVICSDTSQYASARIHLSTTGTATDNVTALVHGNNDAGGSESYFAIETKDSNHTYIKTLALYKNDNGNNDSDSWSFNSGTLGRTRFRIQGNGNVGIGNSDPQQLLHVMPVLEGTTSAYVRVTAGDRGSSTGIDVGHDASGNGHVNVVSNGHLDLSTNNTPRVEISNTGFVGIGIDPTTPGITENHMLRLRCSGSNVRGCTIEQPVATDYAEMRFVNDTADIRVGYGGSNSTSTFQDKFYLYTPSTNKQLITADREGRVRKPNNPAFDAYNGPTDITGGVMVYTLTTSNVGSHYSTSTGRFTAPVAGMYHFTNTSYRYDNIDDGIVYVRVNGSNFIESRKKSSGAVGWMHNNISTYINLNAGDYVDMYAQNRTHNNTNFSRFQGVLVQ